MKKLLVIGGVVLLAGCAAHLAPVGAGAYAITDGRADTSLGVKVQQTKASVSRPPQPLTLPGSEVVNRQEPPPVDIRYAIAIMNRTQAPLTVRHVTLSVGGGYISIPRTTRNYDKTIAPGATEKVEFWVDAREPGADLTVAMPPRVIATIDFDGAQGSQLESFLCNVNGGFGASTTTR